MSHADTKFSIRYRMTRQGNDAAETYPIHEWTEDYGAATDFRNRLNRLTDGWQMKRDAIGDPDADGSWINPETGHRLSWWIV